jgi:predicted RNA-binding protein
VCLATVVVDRDGRREEVMRDVAWVAPGCDGLVLANLLGEQRALKARIKSIDLLNSSIVLEAVGQDRGEPGM